MGSKTYVLSKYTKRLSIAGNLFFVIIKQSCFLFRIGFCIFILRFIRYYSNLIICTMRNAVISIMLIGILFMWSCENMQITSKPNIIVFFVDDMGYNDVGFMNSTFHTPNIDKVKQGLKVLHHLEKEVGVDIEIETKPIN